jgi:hypothetical protein
MRIHKRVPFVLSYCFLFIGLLSSCYKKDVQVGSELAESHTRIITVDTVSVVLSSYIVDSFPTNGNNFALIGNYQDSYSGKTTASTFLQLGPPTLSEDATTLLPKSAVYDSLVLIMKPSGYYYGDTTKPFSISVFELAEQPDYKYATYIFNNSNLALKSSALASWSNTVRPNFRYTDTIKVRMPQAMGADFYDKIRNKAPQVTGETNFLDYFKGLCIKTSNTNSGPAYGFNLKDSSIRMRLYYHLTLPQKTDKFLDFVITRSSYQFNRIVTDRTGTSLEPTTAGQREFFASATNPFSITQAGTGVYLKVKFPSVRDLLKVNEVVRLMDAKLVLTPVKDSYDQYTNKLPGLLQLKTTDASNIPSAGSLPDTTGNSVQFRAPVIDFIYGTNTTYTFNITPYVSALMNTSGSAERGLFVLEQDPNVATQINRAVMGSRQSEKYQSKLIVNLLTIE